MKSRWLIPVFMAEALMLTGGCYSPLWEADFNRASFNGANHASVHGVMRDVQNEDYFERVSLDHAYAATVEAMTDLQYVVESKDKDALTAKIYAHTPAGKSIEITLRENPSNFTKISITSRALCDINKTTGAFTIIDTDYFRDGSRLHDKIKSHF